MRIETRAVHAGRRIDPATGAVTSPIHLSTTFERSSEGEYPLGFSYSREGNPNQIKGTETMVFRKMGNDWQVVMVHGAIDAKAITPH